ncbi:MAG: hypothetical protein Ct9H300mP1_21440 [Planctomycetaceae bacterium]|nr:MAG: hypothetical protein Ct9H300mP1_21440 [Planctomycetaceae bacterium]
MTPDSLAFPTCCCRLCCECRGFLAEEPRDPFPPGGTAEEPLGHLRISMKSGHIPGDLGQHPGRAWSRRVTRPTGDHPTGRPSPSARRTTAFTRRFPRPAPEPSPLGKPDRLFCSQPKDSRLGNPKSYYFALVGEEQRIVCRSVSITAPTEQGHPVHQRLHTVLAPRFRKDSLYHYVVPQGVAGDQRPLIHPHRSPSP